jgi:plastocyanin
MNRGRAIAIALVAATASSACGASSPQPAAPVQAAAHAEPVSARSSAGGTVVGTVAASGTAVVALEPETPRTFPEQTEKPVMDQVGLTFGPELLLVRTGQPVEFRNNDDTLHNVNVKHEETREQAFNVAIPTGGVYEHTFSRDGFYRVACDIHPAMAASIFAASTPYTAVAGGDGRFTFTEVPPGAWTITVYTGGRRLQKAVEVKGGVTEVTVE